MELSIVGDDVINIINRSVSCFTNVTLSQESNSGARAGRYQFSAFKKESGSIEFKLLSRGNPSFTLSTPIACETDDQNIYFKANILSVEKDRVILATPGELRINNKRSSERIDTSSKNFDVLFINPDRLDYSIQNMSLRGKLADISDTGLSLNTSVYEVSKFEKHDKLIFTLIKGVPFKVGIESEVIYVRHLNLPTLHPYFKIGVRFKKPIALSELML